ncbi:MAG: divalent-cation tolerance protein CutA [Anaerolineaceae bacterium]|nr:divalent-cation tolerance protein CutA [Anaerolineaceae bacterium]
MKFPYVVVMITIPTIEGAKAIADMLIRKELAACVNITSPVNSMFRWEGELCYEEEIFMMCKTRAEVFDDKFIEAVRELHPYEVPEIIALPIIAGDESYLKWINDSTL